MLLHVQAEMVAIFVRHNHVADHSGGRRPLKLSDRGGHVGTGHDIEILAAKSDLDDFAHRGAVINEIYIRFGNRVVSQKLAHDRSLSAGSRCASSNSRRASSNKSVARRWTVR